MYWKLLTHDFRPPLQGGKPLCDGQTWPVTLPEVPLDRSENECGKKGGWHFCHTIEAGFKIAGMWQTGRSNAVVLVEPHGDIIERGNKLRASSLTLHRCATIDEIQTALLSFSSVFGEHQQAMATEQWLWWQALQRPQRDRGKVIEGLQVALDARSLKWQLREFPNARDAREAWNARDAWEAWEAWDARFARDALTYQLAVRSGWLSQNDKLTLGIRDAYFNGLATVIPTGPNELGWAMEA